MTKLDGCSVLVVDDDRDTLELYARALMRLGANVRVAQDAGHAIELLEVWRPHAVICDLHLPGLDGYGLLERIRADDELRRVPVIAISASHPAVEHERSLRAGFAQHLAKPTKLDDIVEAVVAAIGPA